MTRQNHIIRQQVFQVELPGREHAQEVYGTTSRLFNNELTGMMENLFDELVPEDRLLKIETLELDLGSCTYADFEQTLMEALIPALRKELSSRLLLEEYEASPADSSVAVGGNTYAELLSHYLSTGTLPWWATGELLTDPGKVFDHLLAGDSSALKALLLRAASYEHARQRLIYQFSEAQVKSMISLFEPQQAAFIFGYHKEIAHVQQEEQVVQEELSSFKKTIWFFILTFLLADRSSHFDRRMFVMSTLSQMAAHFNVSYEALLLIFSSALETPGMKASSDNELPLLIRELLDEYMESHPLERLQTSGRGVRQENHAAVMQKQYDALRYYLLLGSLPGNDGRGKEDLAASLSMLAQANPALARQLLIDTGSHEAARSRMATFGEPFVKQVVELVEPAHAEFITGYAEKVQQLQASRYIIKIRNDQFGQALWEFIFAFLFTDTASLFSARMFVEDHVRRMARHYNLQFHELLVFMAQAVGEDYTSANGGTSLFYLLTGLLKDHMNEPHFAGETGIKTNTAKPGTEIPAHIAGRDVLVYWLRHGFMPWWSGDGVQLLPQERLEVLLQQSPAEALNLLKLAGTSDDMKSRMLYQLPVTLILKLFALLPQGETASALLSGLLASVSKSGLAAGRELQSWMSGLLWAAYEASSYELFDGPAFVEQVIYGLANVAQRPVKEIIALLGTEHSALLTRASMNEPPAINEGPVYAGAQADLHTALVKRLAKGNPVTKGMLVSEAVDLLRYFLSRNAWPSDFSPGARERSLALIRQLVLFLYSENSQALNNILNEDTHAAPARLRMHDAFSIEAGGPGKNVTALLGAYFHTDLLNYIRQQEPGSPSEGGKLSSVLQDLLQRRGNAQALWQQLLRSEAISKQAAYQYRGDDFYQVVRALGHEGSAGFLKDLQYLLHMASRDTMEREQLSLLFREFSFLFFSSTVHPNDGALYMKEFYAFLASRGKNISQLSRSMLRGIEGLPERHVRGLSQLIPFLSYGAEKYNHRSSDKLLDKTMNEILEQTLDELALLSPGVQLAVSGDVGEESDHKKRIEDSIKKQAAELTDEHGKIYIANAGLVLLHPFIPALFERTGLTEKQQFVTGEKQRRAVHLLEFAVRGTDMHDEQFLVLNKLLCGMPPEMPVEKDVALSVHEKQVVDELLQMVIGRWERIGNTSKEGLRETFLLRDGSLAPGEEAWTLKVDSKAFDVLLPYLPWAFGIVKTPWMQKPIHVEWM